MSEIIYGNWKKTPSLDEYKKEKIELLEDFGVILSAELIEKIFKATSEIQVDIYSHDVLGVSWL